MKVRMGTHVFTARLRFDHRYQTWMIAVGPVMISRVGLEAQGASLCASTPHEEKQLRDAGFGALHRAEFFAAGEMIADVDRLAS